MNNKPVAIVNTNCENNIQWYDDNPKQHNGYFLYTHPVKELDEQFEKGFKAGKEEGWKAHKFHHPVEEQDESFDRTASHMAGEYVSYQKELTDDITLLEKYADNLEDERPNKGLSDVVLDCVELLRKAQE